MYDMNDERTGARLDLNLLLVFEAILRERSVTRAAARLGLSQPAMSHALNRLRHLLGDQVFVRTPQGMLPTPRGERLAEPVRHALLELRTALETEHFAPEETHHRFVVAVNNHAAIALVGPILQKVAAMAPHIRLRFVPSGTLDVADLLDRAELDLALVARPPAQARFHARELIDDQFVGLVRRGHPVLGSRMDAAAFAALPHLAISSSGDDLSAMDAGLAEMGLERAVRVEAPYLSIGAILMQSDMIAVTARHIGEEFRRAYAVQLVELPVQPEPLRSHMVWHRRFDDHPAHRWLRETVLFGVRELGPR
jgi:DNA-binding transcriptional LysR family regulator